MQHVPAVLAFRPAGPAPEPVLTMRQLARDYIADRAADLRDGFITAEHFARTRRHLRTIIRRRRWGGIAVADFKPRVARRWLRSHKGWKSPHQFEGAYRVLRMLFKWAENEEIVPRSPIRGLKRFWPVPAPRTACRPEEFDAIMRAAHNQRGRRRSSSRSRLRIQLWTLWQLGCRTSELRAARWEWLDLVRGVLEIPKGKTTGRTGRSRTIFLSDRVLRVLRWMTRGGRPASGFIFTAQAGRPLKRPSWNRLFAKYRSIAGVRKEVTQYSLRHGFCVRMLQAGVDAAKVALLMGHAGLKMVLWYARFLELETEHLREEAGRVKPPKPTPTRRSKDRPDQPLLF